MTNREESNAAEHETFPGPGPLKTDEAKRGIRPVEQMVDAAIERIAREAKAREAARSAASSASSTSNASSAEPGHAITLAPANGGGLVSVAPGELTRTTDKRGKGRLRWRGLEVSEEFRNYADRVARGEDLPPFTGKILAEPDPAFPWDPTAQKRAARRALKQQIGLWTGVALFLGMSIAVLVVQVRKQADAWQVPESPLASVTMANQPSTEALAEPAPGGAARAPGETAPAAFNEGVQGTAALNEAALNASAANEPALGEAAASEAALREAALREAALREAALREAAVGQAAAQSVAPGAPAALATPKPASAVQPVAPRAVASVAPASAAAASQRPAASPPGASGVLAAASSTAAASRAEPVAASASEPSVTAVGTAGTRVGAGPELASGDDSVSALRADPKKEPSPEASAMGSLLVESPSF